MRLWWVSRTMWFLLLALLAALPPSALALTASQVYEQVKDSVVVVKAYDQTGKPVGLGSGVMLPSGDIITNYHVVKSGVRYMVGQGRKGVPATLKAGDPDKDLCLLTAPGLAAKLARLGQAARLKVGEPVYAVGAPQGLELSLSEGIVSQLRGGPPPLIQTTVAISQGSSGGGLFNADGELVGITTFYLKDGQSLNFALPVEWIVDFAKLKPSRPIVEDDKSPEVRNPVERITGNRIDISLKKAGFTYKGMVNGFLIYNKPKIKLMVRDCNGFLCEGLIVADPVSDEMLSENLIFLYGGLQNTFLNQPTRKVKWVEPDSWRRRVFVLIEQVFANLKQANRTEFTFDHLNVRGQCDPVSKKAYQAGQRPVLIIKLWIP